MGSTLHRTELQGYAYATRSSHRQSARLLARHDDAGLRIEIQGDGKAVIGGAYLSQVTIDPPLGRSPRKLTLPDGTVFETDDHEGIKQLTGRTHGTVLHDIEAFRPRLFGVIALCLAATWVLWRYGLDIMVAVAIAFTPAILVEQIDNGTLKTMDFAMAKPSELSDGDKAEVTQIYRKLLASLPEAEREKHSFDLQFRNMPGVGPNAFALPGGTMVMTDALAETFSDPDVIAGVLGHEIGHVVEEHGLKRLYRSLSLYVLIAFLAGDTGPILEDVILEGNLLLSLSFSRAQETSADRFGLALAKEAGFNPSGLLLFFETLQNAYGGREPTQWMSTHPSSSERLRAIEAFIDTL
ncbi:metalloprotease [Roseobacter cerasinus]|uniref:Metalloprotease n=1 Tax=Roseobacter cerasinus TaxID=2602289 RepID=A0A640VUL0_9RHOB|nr:M48 family metallopeptidase [Roseobacter cerasinus]GFE51100.1 metalloprotease [Roseobacter cerasinus]